MTNYCKSNVRRVINYTNTEPLNKYDLWLSENLRYNEDGELEYDNNGLPACDLILKIFRNGKWEPIVGYNTTAGNKINIVDGVLYTYTAINHPATYTNHGFSLNHLPLFRNPLDSPDELFDAGTLGLALNNFVTYSDWQTIIEDGGLGLAITYQIGSGGINIRHAEDNVLGGIFAARYNGNYADSNVSGNTFLTQCKYKYQAPTDYHLYVHAKDIMQTIHDYTEEHGDDPDFPGIVPPGVVPDDEVPALLYNWFVHSRSIKKDWNPASALTNADKPHFSIWGSNNLQNAGKLLRMRPDAATWEQTIVWPYDEDNNILDWVSPDELFGEYSYELPLASLGALGGIRADRHTGLLPGKFVAECKLYNPNYLAQPNSYRREALCIDVRDVKQALDDWYADNDSTIWDLNIGSGYGINTIKLLTYNPETGVTENRYTHILDGYTSSIKQGSFCRTKYYENGNAFGNHYGLEWVSAQTIVEEGLGIGTGNAGYLYYNGSEFFLNSGTGGGGGGSVTLPPYLLRNNCTILGEKIIYVPNGGTGGNKKYLNGYGEWSVPEGTTYNDFSGSAHGLVPQSTLLTQDKYLKGDGTWGVPSVEADFEITLNTSIEDDADFTLNDTLLTSNSASNPVNERLSEWNYYNIDGDNKTVQFTFVNTHVSGNAIYIRFNTAAAPVTINTDADIILSNETMSSSRRQFAANSSYLITIQFGIIKIEKITVNSNSSDSQN